MTESDLVSRARDLLFKEKRALDAEKLVLAYLAHKPHSRPVYSVLLRVSQALFRYDVSCLRAQRLLEMDALDEFHVNLFVEIHLQYSKILDRSYIERITEETNPEPVRLAQYLSMVTAKADVLKAHPALYGQDTPVEAVIASLNEVLAAQGSASCEMILLDLLHHRREPRFIDFAYHFFSTVRVSEGHLSFVRCLRAFSFPWLSSAQSEYAQVLIARGHSADALEMALGINCDPTIIVTAMSLLGRDRDQAEFLQYISRAREQSFPVFLLQMRQYAKSDEAISPPSQNEAETALVRQVTDRKPSFQMAGRGARPPRVAVCIAGQLRGHENAFRTIDQHLVQPYRSDVFVYTWDETGNSQLAGKKPHRFIPYDVLRHLPTQYHTIEFLQSSFPRAFKAKETKNPVDAEELRRFYSAKDVVVDNESAFDRQVAERGLEHLSRNQLKMFYTMKRCMDLATTHAERSGDDYDIVIRVRPDLIIDKFLFDLDGVLRETNPFRIWVSYLVVFGISDQLAIGRKAAMAAYSSVWDLLVEARHPRKIRGFSGRLAEHILWENLLASGIDISELDQVRTNLGGDYLDLRNIVADAQAPMGDEHAHHLRKHADVLAPFLDAARTFGQPVS